MSRFLLGGVCTVLFLVTSCGTNESRNDATIPTEKKLREDVLKYPDSLLLKENLMEYLRSNGNYQQAILEANKALAKDSLNGRLHNIKGTLLLENGDTALSIRSFEKSVSLAPNKENILLLGSLYAQTKDPQALDLAEALLQGPALDAQKEAFFIKGLYYNYSGDPDKAMPYFDTCLKIDYRYLLAYREKAISLYDLHKYEQAIKVLKQAVTINNIFDEAYYWMGRCYQQLNDPKQAIDSYEQALRIDNEYEEAKQALDSIRSK